MAEGLLGGILGEEDEKLDVETTETLAGADAFAAAVAAKLAGSDPGVARKTESFLDKQALLLEIQAEQLKDVHAARLHYLQGQARGGSASFRTAAASRLPADPRPPCNLYRNCLNGDDLRRRHLAARGG